MFSLSSINSTPATQSPPSPPSFPSLFSHFHFPLRRSSSSLLRHQLHVRPLRISNIDAADYESELSDLGSLNHNTNGAFDSFPKLKIGIIGFGNYGQFLAKTLARQGHTVVAHSRSDYSQSAANLGVSFFNDPHDLCENHPDVILLCTSILSAESVLRSLPLQRLKSHTLFVDVLSVKEFHRSLFLKILPPDFDILCTHPMFGPESGKHGWKNLPFVYDKVRIGKSEVRVKRCENFIDAFRREGCRMEEMTCAEHDKYAADSQFITHMIGRVLEKLNLESTPINTKGYDSLLNLVDNTSKDSFDLFYGLFVHNINATKQLERMNFAFQMVRQQLIKPEHGLMRKQSFDDSVLELVEDKESESTLASSPDSKKLSRILQLHLNGVEMKTDGVLQVKLVRAWKLTNEDLISKSNPFVELYVHPFHAKMKTSKVINNDLNPIWNEQFEFVVEEKDTQHLVVKVYDDKGLQAAELLGCAQFQLRDLQPGKVKDVWLKLVKDSEMDRGEVQLELVYFPKTPESEIA